MTKIEMIERYGTEWYDRYLARRRESWKSRYQNDSEYRESHKTHNNAYYHNNLDYQESCKARNKARYKDNYQNDLAYRESEKARSKERYHNDSEYRECMKAYYKVRYVEEGKINLIENYEHALIDNFEMPDFRSATSVPFSWPV